MDTVIKFLTFIPWIIYFIEIMLYRINVLEEKECDKEKYFKFINKNFFTSFNVKELVLFCVYIIFFQYNNKLSLEILFPAIYTYLLIDFFHTFAENCKKIQNKWLMVETIILIIGLLIFFLIKKHIYTTYILMFTVSLLSSFIIYIFSFIYKLFNKKAIDKK